MIEKQRKSFDLCLHQFLVFRNRARLEWPSFSIWFAEIEDFLSHDQTGTKNMFVDSFSHLVRIRNFNLIYRSLT